MTLGTFWLLLFPCLLFLLLRRHYGVRLEWWESWLYTAAGTSTTLVIGTECLNLWQALTPTCISLFWFVACLTITAFLLIPPSIRTPSHPSSPRLAGPALVPILLTLLLGIIALLATPNNWDSMTYHLARVAHWTQNHTISPYGTNNERQNMFAPLAEWTILHLTILQGNDQLANLVKWAAYAGSLLAAALIAIKIAPAQPTTTHRGAISATLAATLPMAIFQSTSTQNDLVLGFWMLCAAYGVIRLAETPDILRSSFFGVSAGLALFTKSLAWIYLPPFLLWAVIVLYRAKRFRAIPCLLTIALAMTMINSGHLYRTWKTTGPPLGQTVAFAAKLTNERHSPGVIVSNILRNLSLHLPHMLQQNERVENAVRQIHIVLDLDASDASTTACVSSYHLPTTTSEDTAAMPLHLLIALSLLYALPLILLYPKRPLLGPHSILTTNPDQQRYYDNPQALPEFTATLKLLRQMHPGTIGLISDRDDWEYPLFDPDHAHASYPWNIQHMAIQNVYTQLEKNNITRRHRGLTPRLCRIPDRAWPVLSTYSPRQNTLHLPTQFNPLQPVTLTTGSTHLDSAIP